MSSSSWNCASCTFANPVAKSRCEMCGSNRVILQQQQPVVANKKADPDSWEGDNWSLSRLAQSGDILGVKTIMDSGGPRSNIEQTNGDGWTPLMRAACVGHLDLVKFLIQRGADPLVVEKNGRTLMNVAGTDEIRSYLQPVIAKQAEMVKVKLNVHLPPDIFPLVTMFLHS